MTVATRRHRFAPETRRAVGAAVRLGLSGLRADPPQRLSDWAAEHFKLEGESSHQVGAWEAWPFQPGWMDAFSNDDIEHVDVKKSKRVGYTKTAVAFVCYNIAHRRRKQGVWQPTDSDRDSFVKSEIEPVLDDETGVPAVRAARKLGRSRKRETAAYKAFRDSVAHFLGGNTARAFRRLTLEVVILDEWSAFAQNIDKRGAPETLAKGRLEGAAHPKFVGGSTPSERSTCHVERSQKRALADMHFMIRCPHCDGEHALDHGDLHPDLLGKQERARHGFKWTPGDPTSVRHVCPHCGAEIQQADYLRAWLGTWVCLKTGIRYGQDKEWRNAQGEAVRPPRHVAFSIWSAYSPQRSWVDIVQEFEAALGDYLIGLLGPMQGFVNESLGLTWEAPGSRSDEHALQARAEPFPMGIVPVGALVLTAGVDLQGNRWEIGVWGWAPGRESWPVDHVVIDGNPLSEEDWERVQIALMRRYPQAWPGGAGLGIEAVSIDANYHTQAVLNFVRQHQRTLPVYAVRGEGDPKKPIKGPANPQDVTWRGRKYPNGVKLWQVGVKQSKDLLHGQLEVLLQQGENRRRGYVHFSRDLPREWYEQLTAEQRVQLIERGGVVERWVKRRPRNEVLDCRVYAAHATEMLGIPAWKPEQWARLEARVQPAQDQVAAPAPLPAKAAPPPRPSIAKSEWSSRL